MNKSTMYFLVLAILLAGCGAYNSPATQSVLQVQAPAAKPTVTPTRYVTETPDPFLAVSVRQTEVRVEQEKLNNEAAALSLQLTADNATSIAHAIETQTQKAEEYLAAQKTAGVPLTQMAGSATSAAITQTAKIEKQQYNAKVFGIWFGRFAWALFILALLAGLIYGGYLFARGYHFRASQIAPDEHGRFKLIAEDAIPGKSKSLINPNLAHRAVINSQNDDLTAEQALQNAQSVRHLEGIRAVTESPVLVRRLARQLTDEAKENLGGSMPGADMNISKPSFGLLSDRSMIVPDWSILQGWDGKGPVPFAMSENGLVKVDIQQHNHFGIFGRTGEGKSRYFIRPFVAALLAAGQRVVLIGKTGDFWPFASHPNVKMIAVRRVTDPEEAQRYANYLKRIVDEMDRRDEYMTTHRVSTWDRAGHPATWLFLDEIGNSLSKMPVKIKEEAYTWIDALAKEGRKAGFNLVTASQRAVGFKSIVEQMDRIVFHVDDEATSRIALGVAGAEQLPTKSGQFFAKVDEMKHCISFDPTDDQLTAFLQERKVDELEPIDWIEGKVLEEPKNEPTQTLEVKPDVDTQIRDVLLRMKRDGKISLSKAEGEVYGRVGGGKNFYNVQKIWMDIQAQENATTKPTTTGEMPDLGPVAA